MKKTDLELYKIWIEERRSIINTSWQIFGIASTILFATPFVALGKDAFSTKSLEGLILGIIGMIVTGCIFGVLYNYRRRETQLEHCIKAKEKGLEKSAFLRIENNVYKVPWLRVFPITLNQNRWLMGIIFVVITSMYLGLILLNGSQYVRFC